VISLKKIVGIIARPDKTTNYNDVFVVNKNLITMLNEFDIIPLIISPPGKYKYYGNTYKTSPKITKKEVNNMLTLINMCNGIILQGGDEFYQFDIKIIDYLYQNDIPTLGICLGMQAIATYKNATCYKLENNNHFNKSHKIKIKDNTKLKEIIKKDEIKVNSRHKYAIKNTNLDISALSEDNIIEAIEDKNKKFFLALQWHPESIIKDKNEQKIIKEFINSLL